MKIRPKLVLSFSLIFIIAFVVSSYVVHTTIQSSLQNSGMSDEEATNLLGEIGTSIGITSAFIGAVAILVVFGVSARIALPMRQLDSQLKSQHLGKRLHEIKIKRGSIDKDDEINQVISTINSMTERLNELEEKKEEELAIITHELKTPLASMVGFTQLLQKPKIVGELNPQQIKSLKIIDKNANLLKSMIIDLLDAQKLDLEKMRIEHTHVDITELIEHIVDSHQKAMQEKQIQFITTTQGKISLTTDRFRLEQVFDHLILNAIDFVPKGGKIEIGAQAKDKEIIFYVKDNGVGIPLERQKDLFKKFTELDRFITRRHGGTGLGLSICKGLINAQGGKIWVESEPSKGAAFYFTLPKLKKNEQVLEVKAIV